MFMSLLSFLSRVHNSQFLLLVGLERVPVVLLVPLRDGGGAGWADGAAGGGAKTAMTGLGPD